MATNVFLTMNAPDFKQKSDANYGTTADNRTGAIEVLAFSFSITQKGSEQGGRPRSIEDVVKSGVTIQKAVDSRSPLLFDFCCKGSYIEEAHLKIYGPVVDIPYLTYRMSYVHVSSYAPSGGGALAVESIGLTYGQMKVEFNQAGIGEAKHGNSRTGSITRRWSWVMQIPHEFAAKGIGGIGR